MLIPSGMVPEFVCSTIPATASGFDQCIPLRIVLSGHLPQSAQVLRQCLLPIGSPFRVWSMYG